MRAPTAAPVGPSAFPHDLTTVIGRLPVFRDQGAWTSHLQALIRAERLIRKKDPNAKDPQSELLLQIIYRRVRQLYPPPISAEPLDQPALYERARDYWLQHLDNFKKMDDEINELKTWIFEPLEERQNEDFANTLIGLLFDHGLPCSEIAATLRWIQSRRARGSPSKWNLAAVKAEALHRQTGQPWLEITRQVCPCPRNTHIKPCRDNIIWPRVKKLRQVLAKLTHPRPQEIPESEVPSSAD